MPLHLLSGAKKHPTHTHFEIHRQAEHPGYSTGFKRGRPPPLLPLPDTETEGAMTKYAGEDIMQTLPPAPHLIIPRLRVSNTGDLRT